jgi:farnesyl-diphosphate farnesyltransferase
VARPPWLCSGFFECLHRGALHGIASFMSEESHHEKELGGKLLASVSRSFYLTLKALPRELREPISLAYLLARTADTIADTAQVPARIRLDCLRQFNTMVQVPVRDREAEQALAVVLAADFCPHQTDPAEATLMRRFQDGLAWLHTMQGAALENIRAVLHTIIHGQQLDIERFPADGQLRSLQMASELDEYTYLVAGCVGEFWTKLCFSELDHAFIDGVTPEQASAWGIGFGKGLQLVNILRDLGKDARLGRCYLPEEAWRPLGLTLAQIQANPACLRPVWTEWLKPCEEYLRDGLRYVQKVQHGKLRYATALPLLLGARTVAKLKQARDADLLAGVKVTRLEVAGILAKTTWDHTPEGLERQFNALSLL